MSETTPETSDLRDRLTRHSVIGAELPPQGMAQTIPELMLLCFSCGWMRASEYDAHLLPVVAQEIAAAEQRGRDEVRARVEALLPNRDAIRAAHHEMEDRGQECGCSYKDCYECGKWHNCTHGTTGLANDIRAALAEPAPEEHP